MSKVDWGNVPDWLAGGGAVTALLFAGIAARAALRTNQQQARQLAHLDAVEAERAEERRRSQAATVAAWIVLEPDTTPAVLCLNGSKLPIYDVTFACLSPAGIVLTPYAYKGPDLSPRRMNRVTEHLKQSVAELTEEAPNWPALRDDGQLRVAISFRDTEGRWWYRDVMGQLTESTSGQLPDDAFRIS